MLTSQNGLKTQVFVKEEAVKVPEYTCLILIDPNGRQLSS